MLAEYVTAPLLRKYLLAHQGKLFESDFNDVSKEDVQFLKVLEKI
jgi:hypothetical protein